jgi:hypothetical protein
MRRSVPPNPQLEALGIGQTDVLREEVSKAGRTIRLTLDRGAYQDAQPYHTVAYLKPSGKPQACRYTPFLVPSRLALRAALSGRY